MRWIMNYYQTDTDNKIYYYPYQATTLTSPDLINSPFDPLDLIPSTVLPYLFLHANNQINPCISKGISPRWIELIDLRNNSYKLLIPVPFILLPELETELNNDSRYKGWIGHGEKIRHNPLITYLK